MMRCRFLAFATFTALYYHLYIATALVMPSAVSMARRAIELSNKANVDPSFAEEACKLWTSILEPNCNNDSEELPLPLGAMPAAHALHASTLVRVGRDKEAIGEYRKSLAYLKDDNGSLLKPLTKDEVDTRMGLGKSLQRILRYREAADTFLDVATRCAGIKDDANSGGNKEAMDWTELAHSDSLQSAALCYMRIGDVDSAITILEKFQRHAFDLAGMLGALLHIQIIHSTKKSLKDAEQRHRFQAAQELLHDASSTSASPLYNWIYTSSQSIYQHDGLKTDEPFQCKKGDVYLSFAKVNNSPFDDPDLINLDDKILLHSVVMEPHRDGKDFWPRGYILPQDLDLFSAECNADENDVSDEKSRSRNKWILKERSGYGSHGNSIASADEVIKMYNSTSNLTAEPILCQRIVDPPMLVNSRKFSLRIYVIYFAGGKMLSSEDGEKCIDAEIYVSTEGLVKYASASYVDDTGKSNDDDALNDQYMTNSGRGDGRSSQQHDLKQLQRELEMSGIDYNNIWDEIETSIQIVMKRFIYLRNSECLTKVENSLADVSDSSCGESFIHSTHSPICSIPKIMGFDYIFDSSTNPYLLEVNRFPGLEPRSTMDLDVKQSVVYDAWVAACDRMGIPKKYLQGLRPSKHKGFSLKRLSLD
mmetsp:Transcript_8584/g.18134  ORF Transcript_8584/g.18134 Transcript_8584/m.18134 type:complete len:648 (-) Transcript_8584:1219-3162(-)